MVDSEKKCKMDHLDYLTHMKYVLKHNKTFLFKVYITKPTLW
jgi:hypothetical protein